MVSSSRLRVASASLLCISSIACAFQQPPSFYSQRRRTFTKNYVAAAGASRRNQRQLPIDDDPFGDYQDDENDTFDVEDTPKTNNDQKPPSHFFSKKPLGDATFSSNKQLFRDLCRGAGIDRPSRIQSLAWPVLLEGKHAIVADQTGSGKTLAYLIPLLQKVLSSTSKKKNGSPRLLVLAPTAELADQIRAVCDALSQNVPFKTMVITATGGYNTNIRDQIRLLQRQPVDVLISTPGRIATILRTKDSGLNLSDLQACVLDEVDFLLVDETFGPQLRTVGVATDTARVQFVFCTATLPDDVVETVQREFEGVVQVRGPGLHRVAPTLKEHLVDVSVPSMHNRDTQLCFDVKAEQLLKSLRTNKCRRTLVFCNTVESCRTVENLLKRQDRRSKIYSVGAYHNAMTPESRHRNLDMFNKSKRQDSILICTDRAARGVDFDRSPVDHVVLFDFPRDPAEYVRRVGRTARAGRAGTSTVFCYGWQLPIARSIMGKKLESFTVAKDDEDDDDYEQEYGVQGRKQRQDQKKKTNRSIKAEQEQFIKGNIEGGRMWKKSKK